MEERKKRRECECQRREEKRETQQNLHLLATTIQLHPRIKNYLTNCHSKGTTLVRTWMWEKSIHSPSTMHTLHLMRVIQAYICIVNIYQTKKDGPLTIAASDIIKANGGTKKNLNRWTFCECKSLTKEWVKLIFRTSQVFPEVEWVFEVSRWN